MIFGISVALLFVHSQFTDITDSSCDHVGDFQVPGGRKRKVHMVEFGLLSSPGELLG